MGGPQAKTGVALPSSIRLGEHAVDRFIELVAAAPDGGQRVDRSDWTVRDVAVHVDIGVRAYVAYLQGETTTVLDPYDLSNSNARRLSEEPAQSIDAVIARLRSDTTELFHLLAGHSADETVVWHGEMLSVASLVGLFLGEILVHGGDVARTAGSRLSVSGEEARAVLAGMFEIAPEFVDPVTARGVDATFDLRVRGGAIICSTFATVTWSSTPTRRSVPNATSRPSRSPSCACSTGGRVSGRRSLVGGSSRGAARLGWRSA
jgi:uncharacterized protein (TIGR03083 family)